MVQKEFRIALNSPIYYPGQNLTGKVIVELKRPIKIKALYVKYSGKGKVQWTEGFNTVMVTHSDKEIYLTEYQLVFGNELEESELGQGRHEFNFNCQLPLDLPNSFHHFLGSITYSVKILKNCPLEKNYLARQPVTIASIFDLNSCSLAMIPIEKNGSKNFWGQSKPLNMSVSIPVRGFVRGQIIPVKVILNNESEIHVKSLVATLEQEVIFHAADKSNSVKVSLSKKEFPIEKGVGSEEVYLIIEVPLSSQSYIQFCKIIDLRYRLEIKAKVSGVHKSLKIPIEVMIGDVSLVGYGTAILGERLINSIPLNPEFQPLYNTPASNCHPPAYDIDIPPSSPLYQTISPPSYEESVRLERFGEQSGNDEVSENASGKKEIAKWDAEFLRDYS